MDILKIVSVLYRNKTGQPNIIIGSELPILLLFCELFIIIQSKEGMLLLKVFYSEIGPKVPTCLLLLFLFVLISIIPCLASNYFQLQKERQKQQAISNRVLSIMRMYNCENQEIYESIMSTFDPVLVAVVIAIESEFRVDAVSPAGCRGLMQLSPDKLEDWKNIRKNIQVGAAYLEAQLKRFGDLELAFAAYNAGPEWVHKYQGIPPFKETIAYVKKAKSFGIDYVKPNQIPEIAKEKQLKTLL